jgi:hypothetical protein
MASQKNRAGGEGLGGVCGLTVLNQLLGKYSRIFSSNWRGL